MERNSSSARSRAADRWASFEQANLDELLEAGESRTAFLLRFTLSHPHCHTTIVGTLNPDHLAQNCALTKKILGEQDS